MKDTREKEVGKDWRPRFEGADLLAVELLSKEATDRANAFRVARTAFGLTQNDVAEALKTSQANVSKMERRTRIDLDALIAMAEVAHGSVSLTVTTAAGGTFELLTIS